jgi:hypothetical protein
MSEGRIKRRWVDWVVFGHGKDHSPMHGAKFSYRNNVLYAHQEPVARLVKAPKGKFIVLYRVDGWINVDRLEIYEIVKNIYVEDIGVFSKYPGDMLSETALHERIRELFHKEAGWIVELAVEAPASALVQDNHFYYVTGQKLTQDMNRLHQRYVDYATSFNLKWPNFPAHYRDTLYSILEKRVGHYVSPTEVAKRERKLAREEAKRALGLLDKD